VTVPGRTLQQAKRFNRTFILRSRGREYVVTRLSRGTKARLKFWYLFIQKARIKADWPFYDYERTVLYHFKRNFAQKLKENL